VIQALRIGFLASIILCLTLPGYARRMGGNALSAEWSLVVQLRSSYLDNILRLSHEDIERFQHDSQPFETPLETYDDWKNELTLQPRFSLNLPWRQRMMTIYSFKTAQHLRNAFLNYDSHTLNVYLRPASSKYPWLLNFRIATIPSYYLRVYYDRDTRGFQAARFQSWQYRVAPRFRFWKPLWIELRTEFETLYYNSAFTEYDNETISWGLGGEYNGLRPFTFEAYYLRNLSDNIGYRQSGALQAGLLDIPGLDTEYGDASYTEDEFQLEASGRIAYLRGIPLDGSVSSQIRRRVYRTNNAIELDPFHRGRLDWRWRIIPSVSVDFTERLTISVGYGFEKRTTISDVPRVEQVKDFEINQTFVTFEYRFN
jgi:hypothetical protein